MASCRCVNFGFKKLKDYTLGIDELNVVPKDTGAQGVGIGGGVGGGTFGFNLQMTEHLNI